MIAELWAGGKISNFPYINPLTVKKTMGLYDFYPLSTDDRMPDSCPVPACADT